MTDDQLLDEFFETELVLEEERRSELSYLFMQHVVRQCELRGWTLSRLAGELGVHKSQVSRWLNGAANLRFSTVAKIEAALRVPLLEINREPSTVFAEWELSARPPAAAFDATPYLRGGAADRYETSWAMSSSSSAIAA